MDMLRKVRRDALQCCGRDWCGLRGALPRGLVQQHITEGRAAHGRARAQRGEALPSPRGGLGMGGLARPGTQPVRLRTCSKDRSVLPRATSSHFFQTHLTLLPNAPHTSSLRTRRLHARRWRVSRTPPCRRRSPCLLAAARDAVPPDTAPVREPPLQQVPRAQAGAMRRAGARGRWRARRRAASLAAFRPACTKQQGQDSKQRCRP